MLNLFVTAEGDCNSNLLFIIENPAANTIRLSGCVSF